MVDEGDNHGLFGYKNEENKYLPEIFIYHGEIKCV
jgi:hypothetical protein